MSQENVELVTRIYAEFGDGNFWLQDFFDPEVRIDWSDAMFARNAISTGLEELARDMREFFGSWERVTVSAERMVDAGDQVAVVAVWRGRGRTSGAAVENRQGFVWTLRDGRVVDLVTYADPDAALEAVGCRTND